MFDAGQTQGVDAERAVIVSMRVYPEERDALRRLARQNDRSWSAELRRAIRHYLADNDSTLNRVREVHSVAQTVGS